MLKLFVPCLLGIAIVNAHSFTNPLVDKGADPWMVYYKGYYYLLVTPWTCTFHMRKAKTLAELHNAESKQVFSIQGTSCWAPEIHQLDGKWYLYFAACLGTNSSSNCHRNRVAEAAGDDPLGPYTFKASFIDNSNNVLHEIDPSILQINNKRYLMGAHNFSIFLRELTSPTTAQGPKYYISHPTYDWERHPYGSNEGPEPLYHNGKTFVIFSASACQTPDYQLGYVEFVGTDPLNYNHWKKHPTPLLVKDPEHSVYGPGHNGFFKSPDGKEDWIIYHANSLVSGTCDGNRNPRAKKIIWGSDGLPTVGKPDATGVVMAGPAGEPN